MCVFRFRADYDAFGNLVAASGSTYSPFQWGGTLGYWTHTDTSLLQLGARYYAPDLGRFISEDPIGYLGGLNLYSYCANDPVNWSDPTGLTPGLLDGFTKRFRERFGGMASNRTADGELTGLEIFRSGVLEGIATIGDMLLPGTPYANDGWYGPHKYWTTGTRLQAGGGLVALSAAGGLAAPQALPGALRWDSRYVRIPVQYEFRARSGLRYVGQSCNLLRRLSEHLVREKLSFWRLYTVRFRVVRGGRIAREIAEQLRIEEFGLGSLENVGNAIGAGRAYLLEMIP